MNRKCEISGSDYRISELELDYCGKYDVPLPTQSPQVRLRQMLAYRNRPYLYHSTSAFSGDKILSCIPPERGYCVYDVDEWKSDRWSAYDYGREYDFRGPFFEQYYELLRQVPLPNLAVVRSGIENSDYTNGITGAKNCYLLFSAGYNEDCMFSFAVWRSKDILDCSLTFDCELCYGSIDLLKCYNLKYARHCSNCSDSAFLSNCHSCRHCFGCVNLSHKEYCVYNRQLSKSEYLSFISEVDLGSFERVTLEQKKFDDFEKTFPSKYYFGKNNQNSLGNFLDNTKNCDNCYFISDSEDCVDSVSLVRAKNSIVHAAYGDNTELIYNSVSVGGNSYNIRFSVDCYDSSHDLEYCIYCCYGTSDCFGCVGLRRGQYAVLNKCYPKDEYLELTRRIRKQMRSNGEYGKFFPPGHSPFFYNESEASAYFPLDSAVAKRLGFRWREQPDLISREGTLHPDHIKEVTDDIIKQTFICDKTGKEFRFIKPEIDYYKKNNIPLPRISPLERIRSRLDIYQLHALELGTCVLCSAKFKTTYLRSGRPLYCEKCYQDNVRA